MTALIKISAAVCAKKSRWKSTASKLHPAISINCVYVYIIDFLSHKLKLMSRYSLCVLSDSILSIFSLISTNLQSPLQDPWDKVPLKYLMKQSKCPTCFELFWLMRPLLMLTMSSTGTIGNAGVGVEGR